MKAGANWIAGGVDMSFFSYILKRCRLGLRVRETVIQNGVSRLLGLCLAKLYRDYCRVNATEATVGRLAVAARG